MAHSPLKLFLLLAALLFPAVLSAQTSAPLDVANIELMIAAHKKQHDRLEKRNSEELKHNAVTKLVNEVSEGYEKVHKELMSKYSLASQWASLGINSLNLLSELNSLRKVLPPFIKHVNKIKDPAILLRYVRAAKAIKGDIDFLVKVVSSVPALRLNANELSKLVSRIRSSITNIIQTIRSYTQLIQGRVAINNMFGKVLPPDRAKIAISVIKEFSKKDNE